MSKLVVIGTSSGAGKSTIVTVLCHLFSRYGLKVCPYKAQNMSLNSTSTWLGEEIAYIQYVQCISANVEATAHVNPILLKPLAEHFCEVIVLGTSRWIVDGHRYMTTLRLKLWEIADYSLKLLAKMYDVVIVEGAGAGFEPNLYSYDLANRLPLTHRDSKCIIVVDIYRGGAFTSALGLYLSLPVKIRDKVIGFIINRFCGDERLLATAIRWIESRTGKRVLGVVPLRDEFDILPEDSLDIPSLAAEHTTAQVDVAVVWYPYMSNFGEIQLLKLNPHVNVRLVKRPSEIGEPDLLVLPGSRNVIKSLEYLSRTGLTQKLHRIVSSVPIVGVCGGLEILSDEIADPHGLETGLPVQVKGIGLIPAKIRFTRSKTVSRLVCRLVTDKSKLTGFEIRRGVPVFRRFSPLFEVVQKNKCQVYDVFEGYLDEDNMCYATMIHEVIARPRFLNYILRHVNRRVLDVEPEELLLEKVKRASQLLERYVDLDPILKVLGE